MFDKATGCVSQPIKPKRKRHDEGRQVLSVELHGRISLICPLHSSFSSTAPRLLFCFRRRSPPSPFPCSLLLKGGMWNNWEHFHLQLHSTPEKRAWFVWLLRFRSTSCFLLFMWRKTVAEGTVYLLNSGCKFQKKCRWATGYKSRRWARLDLITTLTYGPIYKNEHGRCCFWLVLSPTNPN